MQYSDYISTKKTPQTEMIPGSTQVPNSAGGFAWQVDDWTRLGRFLILGAEGGTYYVQERKLVKENAQSVIRCVQQNPKRAAEIIAEISTCGRAPKNDAAIFATAIGCAFATDKKPFYEIIGQVCRTGTHLFQFCQSIQDLRGWSRGLRRAVGNWYTKRNWNDLEYQLLKYKQRNGWTHRDVLRLSHPKAPSDEHNNLLRNAVGKPVEILPARTVAVAGLHSGQLPAAHMPKIIKEHKLTREMIPTELMKSAATWDALLHSMPITAAIRSLGQMSACGLVTEQSDACRYLCDYIQAPDVLKKGRVHPVAILNALRVYSQGHGEKGSLSWTPSPSITRALDNAFYTAFQAVEPTRKRYLLGLDVSGSMFGNKIAGTALDAASACAAMAMVTARTEANCTMVAFSHQLLKISIPNDGTLEQMLGVFKQIPFGGTNCTLPIQAAMQTRQVVDTFIIYTDSETYAGNIHPAQALRQYRKEFNPDAKLIVVGMCSNGFTIADPDDKGMLDVVGFDTAVPQLISDFVRG